MGQIVILMKSWLASDREGVWLSLCTLLRLCQQHIPAITRGGSFAATFFVLQQEMQSQVSQLLNKAAAWNCADERARTCVTSALNSGRAFLYQHQHSNNSGIVVRRDHARTSIPKTCRSSSEQCGTGGHAVDEISACLEVSRATLFSW